MVASSRASVHDDRPETVHESLLVIDGHCDLFQDDLAIQQSDSEPISLLNCHKGAVDALVLTVHQRPMRYGSTTTELGAADLRASFDRIVRMVNASDGKFAFVSNPDELMLAKQRGLVGIILAFQNASTFGGRIDTVLEWIGRGIQVFAFTHIGNNEWAGSSRPFPFIGGPTPDGPLSPAAIDAVSLLEERGVIVDGAQLSDASFESLLKIARRPIVVSHVGLRRFVDCERNISDDQLRMVRDNGGLANIVAFSGYLKPRDSPELIEKLGKLWQQYGLRVPEVFSEFMTLNDSATMDWDAATYAEFRHEYHDLVRAHGPQANIADLVDSIEHAANVVGIDHVGIASDFNHNGGVSGWRNESQSAAVTSGLLSRGFSREECAAVWGGNFMRIWRDAAARR